MRSTSMLHNHPSMLAALPLVRVALQILDELVLGLPLAPAMPRNVEVNG